MNLNIIVDKKYYKSDAIDNGRISSRFFETLTRNVFHQSYNYWKKYLEITGNSELPILHGERNLYSTFAAAIDKITPVHLSEWSFNQSDHKQIEKSRRVDMWCLSQEGKDGNPINYFMEIKKGWYNLNETTYESFQKKITKDLKELVEQTKTLKTISPQWEDVDDVFIGISIIHGYYRDGKEYYDESQVRENIYDQIDKRLNAQLLISTWILPENMEVQWEKDKCRFISIAGIVISKRR